MKANYICSVLAGLSILLGASGCSDNMNADLEPVKREKILDYDVESESFSTQGNLLSLDAASNSVKVKVTSNTRWAVEVSDGSGWCDVDTYNGLGDGEFTISVKENYSNATRQCRITITMTDATGSDYGSRYIDVAQAASSLNVSPQSLQTFPAEATETQPNTQEFTIQSNVPWTLTVSFHGVAPFLTVIPSDEGSMHLTSEDSSGAVYTGSGDARFTIKLQNNRTAVDRRATLTVHGEGTVDNKTVEITQSKTTNVFDVSPVENQLIAMDGGTIDFGVQSIFKWSVSSAADWITFSVTEGESSDKSVRTVATIAPNQTGFERSTQIWFIPDRDSGVESISVWVSQTGSREAAISVPWLADGYGQTFATVYFNYFSPFEKVTEAGLQWRRESDEEWESRSLAVSEDGSVSSGEGITVRGNPVSGTATIYLTGLDPAMNYVARGFVREENGNYRYGTATHPFRTAGQYPTGEDVPTPTE